MRKIEEREKCSLESNASSDVPQERSPRKCRCYTEQGYTRVVEATNHDLATHPHNRRDSTSAPHLEKGNI